MSGNTGRSDGVGSPLAVAVCLVGLMVLIFIQLVEPWIMLSSTARTEAVTEFGMRTTLDIFFQLIPVTFTVSYLLAMGTDRDNPPQSLLFAKVVDH